MGIRSSKKVVNIGSEENISHQIKQQAFEKYGYMSSNNNIIHNHNYPTHYTYTFDIFI